MEQKIKRQKMMAPKRSVDKSTWQRISRCVDAFDRIYENTSNLLDLKDDAGSRNIILGNEIIEWRAFLRHSKFLDHNDSSTVFNIYGEPISSNFLNLTEKLKQKRLEYWRQHREGVHLQKISYPLLQTFTKKADEYSDSCNINPMHITCTQYLQSLALHPIQGESKSLSVLCFALHI